MLPGRGSTRVTEAVMSLRNTLRKQLGWATWAELVPHFARGVVIVVRADLDLIDAAEALAADNGSDVQTWLDDGRMRKPDEAESRAWMVVPPKFQFVIVQPWVVVQILPEQSAPPAEA